MKLSRREFLIKGTALLASLGIGGPAIFGSTDKPLFAGAEEQADAPALVVVQLTGGNDGINTVVPYGFGGYFDARTTLRITENEVLPIDHKVGLHPSLTGLHDLYKKGNLAVIQGVGYPNPNRSHFRSMEIWQTAEPEKLIQSGWLARYIESSLTKNENPLKAIKIGNNPNKVFNSKTVNVPVIQSLDSYNFISTKKSALDRNRLAKAFVDMYDPNRQGTPISVTCKRGMDAYDSVLAIHSMANAYQKKVEYPNNNFAKDLQLVAQFLAGKSGTRVFYVELGGFDDHAEEKAQHAALLRQMDEALSAFYDDLEAHGLSDQVVTMAFSEFGRRVQENGSFGTDHGTAGPVLVFGGRVKGGLYGVYPSMTDLDQGDLKYTMDFRSVYSTLVDDWLQGDARSVLGRGYEKLKLFKV